MCDILIFGGTAEGRELSEYCKKNNIRTYLSVATEYGANLLEKSDAVKIITGRKNGAEIADFICNKSIKLVIDSTHPYAVEASCNIKNACAVTNSKYIRVKRPEGHKSGKYFDSINSVADYLNNASGNILITTGSKELSKYKSVCEFSKRCAVRVLPADNIISICIGLGFRPENIIAEQGPFTKYENINHIKKYNVEYLVTKESGVSGGFEEKAAAAEECGIELLVIKRPYESGITLSQAEKILLSMKTNSEMRSMI